MFYEVRCLNVSEEYIQRPKELNWIEERKRPKPSILFSFFFSSFSFFLSPDGCNLRILDCKISIKKYIYHFALRFCNDAKMKTLSFSCEDIKEHVWALVRSSNSHTLHTTLTHIVCVTYSTYPGIHSVWIEYQTRFPFYLLRV